jgi:DNA polymerase-3 subunit delta
MEASELEAEIKAGKIAPVYVLGGTEPLLITRMIAALVEATVPPATRAFNFDQLEGKGATANQITNLARTLPMMGKRRLVLVRDIDAAGAETLNGLIAYLDAPVAENVLCMTCGKVDGRLKFFATAKKKGLLHDLTAPRQLGAFIGAEARRAGARLDPQAARRLEEVVGKDLSRLSQAIEQLALYAGEGQTIGVEHVDALVADTSERTVFQLNDAIGQGDRPAALRALGKLLEQRESAVGVVIMLARHLRQLALYQSLAKERASQAEMIKRIGAPPFVIDRSLAPQSRRFTPAQLAQALTLTAATDRELKGPVKQALGEDLVLARLVDRLCALGSKSR